MNIALDVQEAIRRMSCRNKDSICWTLTDMTVEYKYINTSQARNWDGTFAGDYSDNSRRLLQRMVWRDGELPRYTNFW